MTHKKFIVIRIINENKYVKTLFFDKKLESQPGQFIMAWLPGFDEKPFVFSYDNAITFEAKGKFTRRLSEVKVGDAVFIRGPYGNGYTLKDNACIVAGGVGMACTRLLVGKLNNPNVIYGARSKEFLCFKDMHDKAQICTDNGSEGYHGFTTDLLKELLNKKKIDIVYTCGPEIMMLKIMEICKEKNIECEVSLERYMGCGIGICGSCVCGNKLVCKDGPIFNLDNVPEFGKTAKLKSGRKVPIKEFYEWRN